MRLPQVQLPKFEGKISDDLDRFIEQFNLLIKSSGISSRFWTTFLKEQVQTDQRAFDIVAKVEIDCKTSSLGHDPTKASEADFCNFYEKACEILVTERGAPSDQRIHQLLHEYYLMVQNPGEKVSEFSHRFLDVQHALEKLVPGIHYLNNKSDLELRQAFIIKLQPTIQKKVLSRAVKYESLQELISVAEPFESVNLGTVKRDWLPQPHALPATTASSEPPNGPPKSCFSCGAFDHFKKYCLKNLKTKGTKRSTQEKTPAVCTNFNRF